jgi:hypothetical protein
MAMLVSGGHSSLLLVPDVTHDVRSLGSTMDDAAGRPSTRSRACSACPSRRTARGSRCARGQPDRHRLPARLTTAARHGAAPLRLLVLRAQDRRSPVGRDAPARPASRCPSPTSPPASRRRSSTCSPQGPARLQEHEVDHLLIGGGRRRQLALRALAEERCAKAGVTLRVPRPGLCTDNGAMVRRWARRWWRRGASRATSDSHGLVDAGHARPGLVRTRRSAASRRARSDASRRGASATRLVTLPSRSRRPPPMPLAPLRAPPPDPPGTLSSWLG